MRHSKSSDKLFTVGHLPLTGGWKLCVDVGGTFTDAIARSPTGTLSTLKTPSDGSLLGTLEITKDGTFRLHGLNGPDAFFVGCSATLLHASAQANSLGKVTQYQHHGLIAFEHEPECGGKLLLKTNKEAPLVAAHRLTQTPFTQPLPTIEMRLATTRGTNALLTREYARTGVLLTQGFEDLLAIGDQRRPDLFSLSKQRPRPIPQFTYALDARIAPDGSVLQAPKPEQLEALAAQFKADRLEALAISLLHGTKAPTVEQELKDYFAKQGMTTIRLSHAVSDRPHYLERTQTVVVDAALAGLFEAYLKSISSELSGGELLLMTSAGGLKPVSDFEPRDGLLSGPAGGVIGAHAAVQTEQIPQALAFDMGGTSTDVARLAEHHTYQYSHSVGSVTLITPALAIETVAAGGGSVCAFTDGRLTVGPQSAGADPGPACYGRGGPLTLTDVHFLLNRFDADGLGIPLDRNAAEQQLALVMQTMEQELGKVPDRQQLLLDWLTIANETMADTIRNVSVRRGFDPGEHALVAFGGAGGLHLAALAEQLEMTQAIVPPDAGILSAWGLAAAAREAIESKTIQRRLSDIATKLTDWLEALEARALNTLADASPTIHRRLAELRMEGQTSTLEVEWDGNAPLTPLFNQLYKSIYGYDPPERELELVSLRVTARDSKASRSALKVNERAGLTVGTEVMGPKAIADPLGAIWVPQGWRAVLRSTGAIDLSKRSVATEPADETLERHTGLELFTHRFSAIARDMGEQLRRTAVSTNIKERLDFSCAVLDVKGRLLVNAPHIPVHLGALGLCVRTTMQTLALGPQDVVIVNHPAYGGSHLPDITLIAPVFEEPDGGALLGFVANRAHHAEVGGIRPGSTPPNATNLAQEGVVLPPTYLVRQGIPQWDTITEKFAAKPYPSRSIQDNIADLRAGLASIQYGERALRNLGSTYGNAAVREWMEDLINHAQAMAEEALKPYGQTPQSTTVHLDDQTPITVSLKRTQGRLQFDFTGTGPVHSENWNATPAITQSALLYVLRLLIPHSLPLNEGFLQAVELKLPECLLSPAFHEDPALCPAVVGGNTETSQRVVDALIRLLGLGADSQGTMNNLLFGNDTFGFYETVGGGGGAGPTFDGLEACHVHMTNTAITDPEVLENRYPVRLLQFSIRRGSGGNGKHRGGNGLIRAFEFLAPLQVSLLAQRRTKGPRGARGGADGLAATGTLISQDGTKHSLGGREAFDAIPGDQFIMETPGGGGWEHFK